MATSKSLTALEKSKEAASVIKERLVPVLQRLTDDTFGEATGRARASVALSVGMMRYMGARLRGLDQGRKPDDPLRKDLNNIKRVLAANTKKSKAAITKKKCNSETKKSVESVDELTESRTAQAANLSSKNLDRDQEKEVKSKIQNDKEAAISQQDKTNNKKKKRKTKSVTNRNIKSPESASKKTRKK